MIPIIILSSERSGTNLLRHILGSNSKLVSPPAPHMLKHLGNHLPYYGPLSNNDNFDQLILDAITITTVEESHLKWKYKFVLGEVKNIIKDRSLAAVVCGLYELYANKENASAVVIKEISIYDYIFEIRELYPQAKFIFLSRDGRDVCCSVKLVPSLDKHVYSIAKTWKKEQESFLRVVQKLLSRDCIFKLRYEELIESPIELIRDLCNFLTFEFDDEMLNFFQKREAKSEAEKKPRYWKNLAKPIIKNNKRKFINELSNEEILIFESIAGDILQMLGYELTTNGDKCFSDEEIENYIKENTKLKAMNQMKALEEKGNLNRAKMLETLRVQRREGIPKSFF